MSAEAERVVSERTPEEEALADAIGEQHGTTWVLVSAKDRGDGLALNIQVGASLGTDLELVSRLLGLAWEAL